MALVAIVLGIRMLTGRAAPTAPPANSRLTAAALPTATPSKLNDDKQLLSTLELMKARLADLEAKVGADGAVPKPMSQPNAEPRSPDDGDGPGTDPIAEAKERSAQLRADLDARVETEGLDANWSRSFEAETAGHVAKNFPGTRMAEIRCAQSACRLDVVNDDIVSRRSFLEDISTIAPGHDIHYFPTRGPDGSLRVTAYVLRYIE